MNGLAMRRDASRTLIHSRAAGSSFGGEDRHATCWTGSRSHRSRSRPCGDRDGRPVRTGRDPRLREIQPRPRRGRPAEPRDRQPGVPAVVGRRGEEAVAGLEPGERQGLRVRGRVRRREAARLLEGAGRVERGPLQQLVPARQEAVRLLHGAGLLRARAGEERLVLERVLLREPGRRGERGHADLAREDGRGTAAVQARRPGRDDELQLHHTVHQALADRRASTTRTTTRSRR